MPLTTTLTRDYGVKHPIALAPMAFVGSTPDLAIAVCRAGGIGSLAAGVMPANVLEQMIGAIQNNTDRPFNINFVSFLTQAEQIDVCIAHQAPIVSFHWGLPAAEHLEKLKQAGIKIWIQVGSVEAAQEAVTAGADCIVAQGNEAGGHNYGGPPLAELLPAILKAVSPVPVLAAGGIATGKQVAEMLAAGAAGVSVGTRFIASPEAYAHDDYKRLLVESKETRLTSLYGQDIPHFNPMRVLNTGLAREYENREQDAPTDPDSQPVIAHMRMGDQEIPLRRFSSFPPTPDTRGEITELPMLAGDGVGLIEEIKPVADIMQELVAEIKEGML